MGNGEAMTNPRMMNASVLSAPRQLSVEEVPFPAMGSHDALIKVSAVGLCGSDYHIYTGEANYNVDERGLPISLSDHPQILGHEVTGVIEALGSEVTDLERGDRVVIDQGLSCVSEAREHLCEYCATGFSHQCEWYREFGITGLPGGLADFMAVPAVNLVKIESDRSASEVVMTEPLACVLHALDSVLATDSRYRFDATDEARRIRCALICGAGPAGILMVQVLRKLIGYEGELLVSEPNPIKREIARAHGATTIDPSSESLIERVLEVTSGRRVEFFADASGYGGLFEEIPAVVRIQGTVLMYAHGHGGTGLEVMNAIQFREPTILSPCGASGGFDDDGRPSIYRRALRLIEDGTVEVSTVVSHVQRGLDSVAGGFSSVYGSDDYVKAVTLL